MYGIYNTMKKEFQFGIREETRQKAFDTLFKKIGYDSYKWRFQVRAIPERRKTMLSKEEIDRRLEQTEDNEITINLLYQKVDLLETQKQKVIEKLELEIEADKEDLKYNNLSDYGRGCLDEAQEILKILKGKNNE